MLDTGYWMLASGWLMLELALGFRCQKKRHKMIVPKILSKHTKGDRRNE
jgi:hypothetical protein